jgi:predicted nucleic acid-binding protein
MIRRYHLDANVVLRFLRNDDPAQSPAAAKLFASASAGKAHLSLSAVTVAEIFYVLARVYRHSRADAAAKLIPLLQSAVVTVENRRRVLDALKRVATANVDFGDAYLAATAAEQGDQVASFDRDLQAFPDITTIAPS